MTQFNNELYAGFLPEAGDARFEGKRGFYPAMTAEEYSTASAGVTIQSRLSSVR